VRERCIIPGIKKHDPYYDRMIDLYKKKLEDNRIEIQNLRGVVGFLKQMIKDLTGEDV